MKREYTKPMVVFEDFCMSKNIAAGCETKTSLPTQNVCGYMLRTGQIVFVSSITGCDYTENVVSGQYNTICYHNPSDDNNLFAS